MSYVKRVLQPGETVRHVSRLHWIVSLPGILLLLAAIVLFILYGKAQGNLALILAALAAILAVFGLLSLLSGWFRRWTTEMAVTDRRIIFKRGFIRRHTIEIHMDKVESVDVEQTILGRLLSYGDITIRGTGETLERLRMIDHPLEFRNHVTAV